MLVDHLQKIKKNKRFKETGNSKYIYQNKLGEACFQHGMAYGDFKDLNRSTFSDKLLCNEGLILLKIRNMVDIIVDLLHLLINFLVKKLLVVVLKIKIFPVKN